MPGVLPQPLPLEAPSEPPKPQVGGAAFRAGGLRSWTADPILEGRPQPARLSGDPGTRPCPGRRKP